jgi:hypothetical protein
MIVARQTDAAFESKLLETSCDRAGFRRGLLLLPELQAVGKNETSAALATIGPPPEKWSSLN